MEIEVNLDNVEVIDANEVAKTLLENLPKEQVPAGVVFNGVACVDCGFDIEPERLIHMPSTCRCGECKGWYDKEQSRKALNGTLVNDDE